jgi:transposase
MSYARKPCPSGVSDDEWSLVVPYLTLMREDARQREHPLRELFNGLRNVIRYGIARRAMPNDLPPWPAVCQQSQRWLAAGRFKALAHDLRAVLRLAGGRAEEADGGDHRQPHAALHAGERHAGRPRRRQAQARLEAAHGGRHAGPPAGAARHARQRRRPRRGRPPR